MTFFETKKAVARFCEILFHTFCRVHQVLTRHVFSVALESTQSNYSKIISWYPSCMESSLGIDIVWAANCGPCINGLKTFDIISLSLKNAV